MIGGLVTLRRASDALSMPTRDPPIAHTVTPTTLASIEAIAKRARSGACDFVAFAMEEHADSGLVVTFRVVDVEDEDDPLVDADACPSCGNTDPPLRAGPREVMCASCGATRTQGE